MMYDLPDHPAIANTMRTGYPDGKAPPTYQCPVCGGEITWHTYLFVSNITGNVIGCEGCVSQKEAEDIFSIF